jgi:hypothetical protein
VAVANWMISSPSSAALSVRSSSIASRVTLDRLALPASSTSTVWLSSTIRPEGAASTMSRCR